MSKIQIRLRERPEKMYSWHIFMPTVEGGFIDGPGWHFSKEEAIENCKWFLDTIFKTMLEYSSQDEDYIEMEDE